LLMIMVVGVRTMFALQVLRVRGSIVAVTRLMAPLLGHSRSVGMEVAPLVILAGEIILTFFLRFMAPN